MTTEEGTIPLYYHIDHMGSSEFLTSDVTQRVTSWTSYDEWGNITHNAVLKCGTRELDLVKTYTGHERDSVLGMYYAKARMYDTSDKHGSTKANKTGDKRFISVDPVKGDVRNPQSLVQYIYVLNNPLMYVDPLGLVYHLTLMKNGGGQLYQTDISDKGIITAGDKRYIGVRNFSDIISAANRKVPNVNLINNSVVKLDYATVSGAKNNITLNLNHIGYNTNVQGVYFRYEQCGHTYVDLMTMSAKMGMQAYIYSDAEFNDFFASVTGKGMKEYLAASGKQVILGNYAEDITLLGTVGQIGMGLTGLDLPADLRDVKWDIDNWDKVMSENPYQVVLDAVGIVPLVGFIKNTDEIVVVLKNTNTGAIEGVVKNSSKQNNIVVPANSAYGKMSNEQLLKSRKSYENLIAEHQKKLNDYVKNPYTFDNEGRLKNAPNEEIKNKIIQGRVSALQSQINKQKGELEKIESLLAERGVNF